MPMPKSITIRRPDDWHVHLLDGAMLAACAVHTARQFARDQDAGHRRMCSSLARPDVILNGVRPAPDAPTRTK